MAFDELRLSGAIAAGKLTAVLARALRLGGGTTMPGRVARSIAPDIMPRLARRLPRGTIIVTGTNGKTTTSRLISHILRLASIASVHNRAGANLASGITAVLVQRATMSGRMQGDVGVFEVDEATLPVVQSALAPRVVVLTNLFRDQLDRYGEIDIVAGRWRSALRDLDPSAAVVFNADDPLVSEVGLQHPGIRMPFGIEDDSCSLGTLEHAADARYCYRCGIPFQYRAVYFGHMGIYRCERCGASRPNPTISAVAVVNRGLDGVEFDLRTERGSARVRSPLPGIYNVHNVLAAAACCLHLGIPLETIVRGIDTFAPAFGRAERVHLNGRPAVLLLAKNPAGFNEVLRTFVRAGGQTALIAINDLTADGRDISWLWDVDFEMLNGKMAQVVVSGLRAEDMALRLKYAGVNPEMMTVQRDLARALDAAIGASNGTPLYILPTYTAMLQLRKVLQQKGVVAGFWED